MANRRITIEVDDEKLSALQDEICAGEELSGVCMLLMPKHTHWHATKDGRAAVKRMLTQSGVKLISDEIIDD